MKDKIIDLAEHVRAFQKELDAAIAQCTQQPEPALSFALPEGIIEQAVLLKERYDKTSEHNSFGLASLMDEAAGLLDEIIKLGRPCGK